MNEKLEKEISNRKQFLVELFEPMTEEQSSAIINFVKYFYNFALEDVRKEVENRFNRLHSFDLDDQLSEYGEGEYQTMCQLKDFIDNLTK